jgi:hypothetical protein
MTLKVVQQLIHQIYTLQLVQYAYHGALKVNHQTCPSYIISIYPHIPGNYEYLGGAGSGAGTGCGVGSRMYDDSIILNSDGDGDGPPLELPSSKAGEGV